MQYNGQKLSDYAKEELPTWAEVYNEFYKNKLYIHESYQEYSSSIDVYWKILHKKFLMITICNQFNKMLNEDGYKNELITMIQKSILSEATDIMFILNDKNDNYKCSFTNFIPPIYSINMPSGKHNPFIISKHRLRIYDKSLNDDLWLCPIILVTDCVNNQHFYYLNKEGLIKTEGDYNDYMLIIDYMIRPFNEYFEGESIGWKDANGMKIESEPLQRSCSGAGYDPAL